MSLFGANKADEEQIKKAFQSQASTASSSTNLPNSESTGSFAHSSNYETASERDSIELETSNDNNERFTDRQQPESDITDNNSISTITAQSEPAIQKPVTNHDDVANPSSKGTVTNSGLHSDSDSDTDEALKYTGDSSEELPQLGNLDSALHREISRISRVRTTERRLSEVKQALSNQPTEETSINEEAIPLEKLDWDGPKDPENPQNWSPLKKWFVTMTTAFTALVVTFGSSLYTCGIFDMVERGMASQELAISGLTFYVLGLSFGPMIAAPLSELYGRRIVYLTSFPISLIFTLGVGFSKKIREVLVLRFFAGLVGSPALAVASGTIVDMWALDEIEVAMSFFCMAPFAGPIVGPVIGGYAVEKESWKWTMWIDLFFGAGLLPFLTLCPETYKPVLLEKRAKKRGIKVAKPDINLSDYVKEIISLYITKPCVMLAVEPIVLVFSIWSAFIFAVLFGFFEAYPVIFRGVYKMSLGNSGLPFLGIGVGLVFGMLLYLYLVKCVFWKKNEDGSSPLFKNGVFSPPVPETRLLPAKIGAIFLPIGLFWVGWSGRESVHWIVPIIGGVPFGFGLILIFFSTITYFSLSYPPISVASAIAANNFLRYILASVFPLFTVQMYENVHIGWASSIFAFIAVAMVPIPWVFAKYGPKLRAGSRFSYAAVMKQKAAEAAKEAAEAQELNRLEKQLTRKSEKVGGPVAAEQV